MKQFIRKMFGITKLQEEKEALQIARDKAVAETVKAQEAEEIAKKAEEQAKLTPKERATEMKEPWVAVLDTHINKENIRNGFFELDWNEYFVVQLKEAGYGFDGDPDEEIVDRWFRDLARNILAEEGQDVTRGSGYINVIPIEKGRSEIS
jgi:hypothetical protein